VAVELVVFGIYWRSLIACTYRYLIKQNKAIHVGQKKLEKRLLKLSIIRGSGHKLNCAGQLQSCLNRMPDAEHRPLKAKVQRVKLRPVLSCVRRHKRRGSMGCRQRLVPDEACLVELCKSKICTN
jgi:hypothetical protein